MTAAMPLPRPTTAASRPGRGLRRLAAILLAGSLVAACAIKYPETRTDTVDERPQLIVANAGEGAELIVNGVNLGPAGRFNGQPGTLRLPKGTHVVEIQQGGQTLHKETVFLTDTAARTIVVPSL
jgi:hypothetical protein